MFSWFKNVRRQELLAEPFPDEWLGHVQKNVAHFALISDAQRQRLLDKVNVFVVEKEWVGQGGVQVTDEMKVTVAAQACLLILGIEGDYCFDGVKTVFMHRSSFGEAAWLQENRGQLIVTDEPFLLGQAWHRGPIVLSWNDVLQGGRSLGEGQNLVFHEFAHHLDGLNGEMDGTPPLRSGAEYRTWYRVTENEYARLVRQNHRGDVTLIDGYGATNQAEFFAVSTECFFQRSKELKEQHPELYQVLQAFYRQDPASWFENGRPQPSVKRQAEATHHGQIAELSLDDLRRSLKLKGSGGDACFTRGVVHFNDGEYERAARDFTMAIGVDPKDGEAYAQRARAHLALGDYQQAESDTSRAIELDIDDLDVHCTRADALVSLNRFDEALASCKRALRHDAKSPWAWFIQGHIAAGQKNYAQAVRHFTQAVRFDPSWAEVYLERAECYELLAEPKRAAADRSEAYRRDPTLRDAEPSK